MRSEMILLAVYRSAPCPNPTKQRYASEAEAYVAADFIFDDQGATLEPYACLCGLWHLTTPRELKGTQTIAPQPYKRTGPKKLPRPRAVSRHRR